MARNFRAMVVTLRRVRERSSTVIDKIRPMRQLIFASFLAMAAIVNASEHAASQHFPLHLCEVTNEGYYNIYTAVQDGWCMETYRFNSSINGETIHIVRASTYTNDGYKISVVRGGTAYNNRRYSFHLYYEEDRVLNFNINSQLRIEENSIEGDFTLLTTFIPYLNYGIEQISGIILPTTQNPF